MSSGGFQGGNAEGHIYVGRAYSQTGAPCPGRVSWTQRGVGFSGNTNSNFDLFVPWEKMLELKEETGLVGCIVIAESIPMAQAGGGDPWVWHKIGLLQKGPRILIASIYAFRKENRRLPDAGEYAQLFQAAKAADKGGCFGAFVLLGASGAAGAAYLFNQLVA